MLFLVDPAVLKACGRGFPPSLLENSSLGPKWSLGFANLSGAPSSDGVSLHFLPTELHLVDMFVPASPRPASGGGERACKDEQGTVQGHGVHITG